ncbi:MAG: nucleoside hydrolase [Oscillospiraceae bacterium]|nr:nucleoside hydrolase [Oscillospiraceae bacterium]
MDKRKIILDCDPGHDDAIAIMMAKHPALDLLAITTVTGNQTIDKVTTNALNLRDYLDLGVPVYAGMALPMVRDLVIAAYVHGETGLDGHPFPPPTSKPESKHAVQYTIDTLLASNGDITLVPVGPLTNIAIAMRTEPAIIPKIKEIVIMGGSFGQGNITPTAEFNIFVDPEAALVVFESGAPIVMMGLNMTNTTVCTEDITARMAKIENKAAELFVNITNFTHRRLAAMVKERFGIETEHPGGAMHDPTCLAWLIDPDCFTLKDMYVTVDINRGPGYGQTVCDNWGVTNKPKNARVAMEVDQERFWNIIEDCIRLYS